ncbi:MAG: helix-turn-helix transcriptional regulator [Candidatus Krumholzibacteriia bacterium]
MTEQPSPPPPNPSLADRVRDLRLARGLTRQSLADRAGVSARTVYNIERGQQQNPLEDTLLRLAAALECPVRDLIAGPPPSPPMPRPEPEPEPGPTAAPPPPLPPLPSPTPPRAERNPRPTPLLLLVLALAVVAAAMVMINGRTATLVVTPHSVAMRGSLFGNLIWERTFASRVSVVERARWASDDVLVGLGFDGLDAGGLHCLDAASGEDRWATGPDTQLVERAFGPDALGGQRSFGAHQAQWLDLDGDGVEELATTWMHIRNYPEVVLIVDQQGLVQVEYAHRGHIYSLHRLDLGDGGRQALLCSAVNNAVPFNSGTLFILDQQTGRSASVDPESGGNLDGLHDGARARVLLRNWGEPYMSWLEVPRLQSDAVIVTRDPTGAVEFQAAVGTGAANVQVLLDANLHPLNARPTDGLVVRAGAWPPGPRGPLDPAWLQAWLDRTVVLSRGEVVVGPGRG